jgi:hypothetical protein
MIKDLVVKDGVSLFFTGSAGASQGQIARRSLPDLLTKPLACQARASRIFCARLLSPCASSTGKAPRSLSRQRPASQPYKLAARLSTRSLALAWAEKGARPLEQDWPLVKRRQAMAGGQGLDHRRE